MNDGDSSNMKETYYLNDGALPYMPCPHDSVIKRLSVEGQFITFFLDADIDDEDEAIRLLHPGATSLIIRYHLEYENDYSIYKLRRSPRHLHKLFPPIYILQEQEYIYELAKGKRDLEYGYNYVAYNSIILKLWSGCTTIVLELSADYVEYEWIY